MNDLHNRTRRNASRSKQLRSLQKVNSGPLLEDSLINFFLSLGIAPTVNRMRTQLVISPSCGARGAVPVDLSPIASMISVNATLARVFKRPSDRMKSRSYKLIPPLEIVQSKTNELHDPLLKHRTIKL